MKRIFMSLLALLFSHQGTKHASTTLQSTVAFSNGNNDPYSRELKQHLAAMIAKLEKECELSGQPMPRIKVKLYNFPMSIVIVVESVHNPTITDERRLQKIFPPKMSAGLVLRELIGPFLHRLSTRDHPPRMARVFIDQKTESVYTTV